MRDTWQRALQGIVEDPQTIALIDATLRRIETALNKTPRS